MGDDASSRTKGLQHELEMMQGEVEAIEVKRSMADKTEAVKYRPTYRAVLANRGFLVKQTLGSGSYSKVKFAHCFDFERDKAAVKIVDRNKAPRDFQQRFLPREIEIWPKLKHPHIIRLLDIFEDSRRVYMILEYGENGDVLRYIQRSGAIKEPMARDWLRQISEAVRYLHEQNITHRDLKLENLLLDANYNIKICDFGFVKEDHNRDLSSTYCGSKSYAAPEILKGEPYDPRKADIWAIGVILYIFVTGKMPFDESKGNHGVLEEHRKLNFPWHKLRRSVSDECKALILWCFKYDYNERPDIYDLLGSTWFKMDAKTKVPVQNSDIASIEGPEATPKPEKTEKDGVCTRSARREQEQVQSSWIKNKRYHCYAFTEW